MRPLRDTTTDPPKVLLILAFAAVYFIWGSTYLAIRYAVETLPPFLMAGARVFIAGAILFGFVGVPRVRSLTFAHWRAATISGGLLFLGCHGLLAMVEQNADSGVAALILATIPVWMVILSYLAGQAALEARTIFSLLLGLAGVAVLVLPTTPTAHPVCTPGVAGLLLISAMSWACGSIYGRAAPLPEHAGIATGMQLLCGGALALLVGVLMGEQGHVDLAHVSTRSLLSLAYLIVFGSLVSFSAYIWLLRVAEPAAVGTYAYVNPAVAVLLGWLFAGESLDIRTAAAGVIIITSVVLVHGQQARGSRQRLRVEAPRGTDQAMLDQQRSPTGRAEEPSNQDTAWRGGVASEEAALITEHGRERLDNR